MFEEKLPFTKLFFFLVTFLGLCVVFFMTPAFSPPLRNMDQEEFVEISNILNENATKTNSSLNPSLNPSPPKSVDMVLNQSTLYQQLPKLPFTQDAILKDFHGNILEAFEDVRPFWKCTENSPEGKCLQREVVSTKRIMVLVGIRGPAFNLERTIQVPPFQWDYQWIRRDILCTLPDGQQIQAQSFNFDLNEKHMTTMMLIACPLEPDANTPSHVNLTFVEPKNVILHPKIPVLSLSSLEIRSSLVEACVAPMHGDVSENLIEWIEYHRLIGVSHFHIYDYDASRETKQIIQYYARNHPDLVTLYNWYDFSSGTKNYHYFGQHMFISHCLYRNMYTSKYLLFFDVDEFLTPIRGSNLAEMINYLEQRYDYNQNHTVSSKSDFVAAYRFANWFHRNTCSPRPETPEEIQTKHPVNLVTQRVFWKRISPVSWNGKLLVNPSETLWIRVALLGQNMNLSNSTGLVDLDYVTEGHLKHYRHSDKPDKGPCTLQRDYIKDYSMMAVKEPLLDAVSKQSKNIWSSF
eukprot:Sdes_comp19449_c0_seq2m10853